MTKIIYIIIILVIVAFAISSRQLPGFGTTATKPLDKKNHETFFAEIDEKGNVLRIIVADQKFIDSGALGDPTFWVQTDLDGTLRKNAAVKGGKYDPQTDSFTTPKPYDSWILDATTMKWKPPKEPPSSASSTDDALRWNETKQEWEQFKVRTLDHL